MEEDSLCRHDRQAAINRPLVTLPFLRVLRLIQFYHWRKHAGRRFGELHVQRKAPRLLPNPGDHVLQHMDYLLLFSYHLGLDEILSC